MKHEVPTKNKQPTAIEKPKLLLVEGKDEEMFFTHLLQKNTIQEVQIIPTGGKEQFKNKFPATINTPGFDNLKTLAIIQDADKDAKATLDRICGVLKDNNFKPSNKMGVFTLDTPKIGIFTLPDGENPGKLESLCLSTVERENIMECVDTFMECIQQKSGDTKNRYKKPKDKDKARCKAFISAMEEDIPSLGIATKKEYWNLDSDKLGPLLNFLRQL